MTALLIAAAFLVLSPPPPAAANPCNYDKQIYCDGGDEPDWQWDGVDDIACIGIPGANANSLPVDYSRVVGKVYYFRNGAYVLVHDSTAGQAPGGGSSGSSGSGGSSGSSGGGSSGASGGSAGTAQPNAGSSGSNAGSSAGDASAPSEGATAEPTAEPSTSKATPTPTATPSATPTATNVSARGSLVPGGDVTLSGKGFEPGTALVIEVHSTPRRLTETAVNASGAFQVAATLPDDLEPGVHTIVVLADGDEVASTRITVVGATSGGSNAGVWLLIGLGVAALAALAGYLVVRRRRRPASDPEGPTPPE